MGDQIAIRMAELEQLFEKAAEKAVKDAEPFIGKTEAAKFLNMSVTTLERRMAEAYGPPRYRYGGKINFLRSELRVWARQWRAGDQTGLG
jgi:hypothetical protein